MPRCASCATTWTSAGMMMCPICGAKVEEPAPATDRANERNPGRDPTSSVRAIPPDPLIELGESAVFSQPVERRKPASKMPMVVPVDEGPRPPLASPASPPGGSEEAARSRPAEPPAKPRSSAKKVEVSVPSRAESRRSWPDRGDDLIAVPCEASVAEELFSSPGAKSRLYPERSGASPSARHSGASSLNDTGVFPAVRGGPEDHTLPAPARPLTAPLVLGILALVSVVLVPLSAVFEGDRIFGILGFCLSAFFLPFGPIAWVAGMAAEQRRREQGLRSESRVVAGRLMGQLGTILLVCEVAALLILIAALRLSGGLPSSFWAH